MAHSYCRCKSIVETTPFNIYTGPVALVEEVGCIVSTSKSGIMWEENCPDHMLIVVDSICAQQQLNSIGLTLCRSDFRPNTIEFVGEGLPVGLSTIEVDQLYLILLNWKLDDIAVGVRYPITTNQH